MRSILSFDDFSTFENLYIEEAKSNNKIELETINSLNQLYVIPIEKIINSNTGAADCIIKLYTLCHVNFYIGLSSLLRQHFAATFNLLRVALDACFAAYILLEEVGTDAQYREGAKLFKNARTTVSADQCKFSKAIKLSELHKRCSQAASHADYTTLNTRLFNQKMFFDGRTDMFGERLYFGIRENPKRFTASCWIFLRSHSLILNIFGDYLVTNKLWTAEEFHRLAHMIEDLLEKLRGINVEEVRRDESIKLIIDALL
jgi:hypothetical protein